MFFAFFRVFTFFFYPVWRSRDPLLFLDFFVSFGWWDPLRWPVGALQVIFAPPAQTSSYATDYTCWLHSLNKLLFQLINILLCYEFLRHQQQKESQWNEWKRQGWSYLTTLTLHIYGVPHWPCIIWKMNIGVLFHTWYVTITNSQRHKKRMLTVIYFIPSRSFF